MSKLVKYQNVMVVDNFGNVLYFMTMPDVDKPQPKAKAKTKSNAKAWAEVAYIITKCLKPVPVLSCATESIHSSTIRPIADQALNGP